MNNQSKCCLPSFCAKNSPTENPLLLIRYISILFLLLVLDYGHENDYNNKDKYSLLQDYKNYTEMEETENGFY